MKLVVCMSGASSVMLGGILLHNLQIYTPNAEIYSIISDGAKLSFVAENKHLKLTTTQVNEFLQEKFKLQNITFFNDNELDAPLASGSFGVDKTIITPCSLNTLAKIHAGICDTLSLRNAAIMLKERKQLILAVREMPFSTLVLEQMSKLSSMGVCIASPVYASYAKIENLEDLQNFFIGKWLDLLEIKHNIFKRWNNA